MRDPEELTDLGQGFAFVFFSFDPDRELNPQYAGVASVDKAGISIYKDCEAVGACWFDTPETQAIPWKGERKFWTLHSLDPLHIEPSIQMYDFVDGEHVPSHHGFIRNGRWEWA